jgi:hypothetical protein
MRFIVVVACLATSGCIAVSARAHVDAVSDVEHHGVQLGINVGFGYAGKKSAVVASLGVDTGTAPTLGVHDTFDYVRLPERRVGWRAGFGGTGSIIGDPTLFGLRLATLYSLRERSSYSSHEKFGGESSDSLLAVSFGTTVGAVRRVHEDGPLRLGGSAGIGLELYYLSRMWF